MFTSVKYNNVHSYIEAYAEYILRQAKQRLKSVDATGQLSNSLYFNLIPEKEGWTLEFKSNAVSQDGEPYADYVQKGVAGTEGSRTYIDIYGDRKFTKYKYKKGRENAPPPTALLSWIKTRGIKGRARGFTKADGTEVKGSGRFITHNSLSFAISKGIQRKGIPATSFYTQPISWSWNLFKKGLIEDLKLDVLKYIKE